MSQRNFVIEKELKTPKDVCNFVDFLHEESINMAGENAEEIVNRASYLPNWNSYRSDRERIITIDLALPFDNCVEALKASLKVPVAELYEKELPIYNMIEYALKGKLQTLDFFFNETWKSRKLVYCDSEECVAMTKVFIKGEKIELISVLRSSNRLKVPVDYIGMYIVLENLIWQYENRSGNTIKEKSMRLILMDYQHINFEEN